MTTDAHRITLTDDEIIALQEAIDRYTAICEAELDGGTKCPYWAHLRSLKEIKARLYSDSTMTSTNSACWPDFSTMAPKMGD